MTRRRAAPRGKASPDGGFTLVELLVALALLGLLASLLYGGLRDGARVWRRVEDASAAMERTTLAQTFLRARLAAAAAQGDDENGFVGGPDGFAFDAPWPEVASVVGAFRFEAAAVVAADGALALRLRWRPADGRRDPAAFDDRLAGERLLVEDLATLRFAYFGDADGDGEPGWSGDWPAGGEPPRLVRVEAAFADPGRVWPRFVAAPP